MSEKKAYVNISKNLGRYDLASYRKDWNLVLSTSYGNVSAMFDEDNEPDIEGLMPSEVLDIIQERNDSYWFSTSQTKDREKADALRKRINELDLIWAKDQVALYEKRVKVYNNLITEIKERDNVEKV